MLAWVKSPRAKRILEGMTDKRRKRDLQTCTIKWSVSSFGLVYKIGKKEICLFVLMSWSKCNVMK